jgi:TetR/AcrR family transcriptional regulator
MKARPRRPSRRPRAGSRDSRAAILSAAQREFAALGFAGAGVDAIARRAGVNKAMIYYHFSSKLGLYRELLRDGFRVMLEEARQVLDQPHPAIEKLEAYIATILRVNGRQPHLAPIMLREIAAGGRQLDPETLRLITGMFGIVRTILQEGRARGELREVDPVLTHLMIMGATIFYMANERIRVRIDRLKLIDGGDKIPFGAEPFVQHVGAVLRSGLYRR